ncbi:TRAP transporter subunit DctM [Spirochaetia bacterium]|nr:TRAP transporter subunit DctM [Spirochaetia bacterium]
MEQKKFSPALVLDVLEKGICIAALVFLAIIAAAEAFARLFGTGVPASTGLMIHILLMLGLFSGMFTAKTGEHLSVALIQYVKNEKARHIFAVITGCIAIFICTIIAWSSVSFIKIGLRPQMIGFIPILFFALALPLGYAVMALRFARLLPLKGKGRILPLLVLVLGSVASLPVIAKLIWGFDMPESVLDIIDHFSALLYQFELPIIILLVAAALMGAPIFTVIAGIALVVIQSGGGESEAVANSIFSALTDTSIIAIPLFTLAGFFLSESRAGERLVHTFRSLFSWIPGGMIIATVIICAFFTSFTGASGVTILALGGILFTVLTEKSSYPERFSIGLLTSAGSIGLLFPPSLPIILAGATIRTNIIHMFLGALIPGIILVIAMIAIGIVASVKIKIPVEPFRFGKALSSLKESALEILLPLFLIAGYFSGIFSLIEIGAISVIYVFIVEVLIHRDIKFAEIPKVFFKALPIIGGVLSIIAVAKALSYAIVDTQIPENLARWMQGAVQSKYLFLLLLNLALLVVGCLMDIFSAILVVLPLVAPLGEVYGINPVHLGVIFIINLEVGFLTPPVGLNLFLASYRFKKPFMEVCRYVLPFLVIQLAVVLLVTYIPALSTYLTRFF